MGQLGGIMKLNNINQIRSEDYDSDYSNLVEQLAETLNPFMQEVFELADGRINFDNRVENIKKIQITADANGKPLLNDKVNTEKLDGINGIQVVSAFNLTNNTVYPTGQPFISYSVLAGGVIKINNITNIQANNKYQLTLVIY